MYTLWHTRAAARVLCVADGRLICIAALSAIVVSNLVGSVATAAGVTTGTAATATLVATINVANLPPPSTQQQSVLPLLVRDPVALAAAKAAVQGPLADSTEEVNPNGGPTLTPGTKLTGAIDSSMSMCGGCTPPDMGLAVAHGYKMEQVNLAGRVWHPNNNPGPVFGLASFFVTGSDFISDPWILYNKPADRWFAGIIDVTKGSERLAVSTSSTPTQFKIYNVPQGPNGSGDCGDQGKIGVSENVLAISTNVFTDFCNEDAQYLGDRVTILNKSELVAGDNTVHIKVFGPMSSYFSLVPALSRSTTATQWFAQVDPDVAHIVRVDGTPPGLVTLLESATPSINGVIDPPDAQQKGTSTLLNTGDARVNNVVWQSNSLIFTNSTACIPNGDIVFRSCLRLIAFDTALGLKVIDKNFASVGRYLFYPAVNVDGAGSIVLGFGRSSTTIFPELRALPVDPLGVAGSSALLVGGTAPNTTGRYGDYFAVAVDPSSTTDLWVAGEIGGGSGGWNTAIRQVTVNP